MRSPLDKQLYHHETALSNKPTMKNKIYYIEKFFKQWIFPCRIYVPIDFFSTNINERYFYIDVIDDFRLLTNTINFSSYSEIRLTKQDNIIVASAIQYPRTPYAQNIDTLTLENGKYLTNGDFLKNFMHGSIICDYKDIPRILFHHILPKVPWIQDGIMATLTNEILRSLKASIRCHQMTRSKRMSMAPILYQINRQ